MRLLVVVTLILRIENALCPPPEGLKYSWQQIHSASQNPEVESTHHDPEQVSGYTDPQNSHPGETAGIGAIRTAHEYSDRSFGHPVPGNGQELKSSVQDHDHLSSLEVLGPDSQGQIVGAPVFSVKPFLPYDQESVHAESNRHQTYISGVSDTDSGIIQSDIYNHLTYPSNFNTAAESEESGYFVHSEALHGHNTQGDSYKPSVVSSSIHFPGNLHADRRTSASPYWADPEGRQPPNPPEFHPGSFLPTIECKQSEGNDCKREYRSVDGRCNNFGHVDFGTPGQPLSRILVPKYDGGMMRSQSVDGKSLLPNPRVISLAVHSAQEELPSDLNFLFVIFGQFVDHDLIRVPVIKDPTNPAKAFRCSECVSWNNSACAPIPVPENDAAFPSTTIEGKRKCLPFTRSVAVTSTYSGKVFLEQVNFNTAFLDLSTVYGSDPCTERRLRLYAKGQLEELKHPYSNKGLPPLAPASEFEDCRSAHGKCCKTGDTRDNEQLGLLFLHTLFLREHNHIAHKLHELNPFWSDEKLYQEARKINIAQYQHIVYREFLPPLVGLDAIKKYGLSLNHHGYYEGYKEDVNPQVLSEFATAAFRIGHTLVVDHLFRLDENYYPIGSMDLIDVFHNPVPIMEKGMFDEAVRGLIGTRSKGVDVILVDSLVNKMFEEHGMDHSGEDLFARNVARGRDHGLPGYTAYREACSLLAIKSWEDMEQHITRRTVAILRQVYMDVHDVDLYVGGLAEDHLSGALIGPTFACIIAYQFLNTRRGDRFWYENPGIFTKHQLQSLRETASLASIISRNFDNPSRTPPHAFVLPNRKLNPILPLRAFKHLNLKYWIDHNKSENQMACIFRGMKYRPRSPVTVSPCLQCLCERHGKIKCMPSRFDCIYLHKLGPLIDETCYNLCPKIQPLTRYE